MRRRLATHSAVSFETFFIPFTTSLSLNWPYPAEQVLVRGSTNEGAGDEDDARLNPQFEAHLWQLHNWSLGKQFRESFPELVDAEVRINGEG